MARAPAKLNFLPLTFDTVERLSGLATAPQKAHLVRPAARLMAQAALSAENTTFGVFILLQLTNTKFIASSFAGKVFVIPIGEYLSKLLKR